ncbi:MAG: type III ribulose-bisphosphate carboxylase [Candidatus Nitrosotalea sp.]|nr:type III ribulose-bisphosphate carboxylase [Candidatus Nitrosotalea sp.]
MKNIDWYSDFVDLDYRPTRTDIVCLFRFEPARGISVKEAVGRIASESSAGTWTTLNKVPSRLQKVMATSYEIRGNFVKVSYPIELWEEGNASQLLSGVAGNIFGMKALKNLRLVDISIPKAYLKHFEGPQFGIEGIRKILKIKDRPITGAVAKPKIGWSASEHAQIAYETWMGGFDLVKDDENLTSTSFNRFEDRIRLCAKMRDKAEKETGERKSALINITGETKLMEKRAKMLHDFGWEYAMIDVVTSGMSAVQTLRETCEEYGLAIHAHRAMHAAFDRNPRHGMTMLVLAKMMRLVGVDQIHIGTAVGKLVGSRDEIIDIRNEITAKVLPEKSVKINYKVLFQDWNNFKPVLPISSGGLHPGLIPAVMNTLGSDIGILVSGGIHGHPKGTRSGAKAVMQAIDATMQKISLQEYAMAHTELKEALGKWGFMKPK